MTRDEYHAIRKMKQMNANIKRDRQDEIALKILSFPIVIAVSMGIIWVFWTAVCFIEPASWPHVNYWRFLVGWMLALWLMKIVRVNLLHA
jgi:hypothetical protein